MTEGVTAGDPVLTVFRSRLRPGAEERYEQRAPEIERLARTMPGFVEVKTFRSEDGERVSLVTFADQESHDAWRDHPEHRRAQEEGRDDYYESFSVQVCAVVRSTRSPG